MAAKLKVIRPELAEALIAAAQGGSDYAFTRLVRLYQSPVRAFLRRLCSGDHARADDLAQNAFMKAHHKIGSYKGPGSFAAWLYQIAYRLFLDEQRKLKRRQALHGVQELPEAEAPSVALDLKLDIDAALARLRPEECVAITLCLSEGLSHEEAAVVLGMPVGTVKSHIARGRKKLKAGLRVWRQERSVN